jgi:hypothetical protein
MLLALAFKNAGSSATVHFVDDGEEATDYLRGNGPYGTRVQFPFPNLNNLPALAAVSMTSTGTIELSATGVRAVGFQLWLSRMGLEERERHSGTRAGEAE